ncbi:MAG: O-succinylbenzoic acid--CoA ligase [Bacteroidia bacterium]
MKLSINNVIFPAHNASSVNNPVWDERDDGDLVPHIKGLVKRWYLEDNFELSTSGSTGLPTRICLKRSLVDWSIRKTVAAIGLTEYEHCLLCLPVTKVGGLMVLLRALQQSWKVDVFQPTTNPMLTIKSDHTYSLTSLTPHQIQNILLDEKSRLKLMRFGNVLIGGAALTENQHSELALLSNEHGVRFFHTYGMTETASHVALKAILQDSETEGYQLFDGVLAELNEKDCLVLTIPELGMSWQTNDLVVMDGRHLHFRGRNDLVVNSGGLKLHISILERRLQDEMGFQDVYFWKEKDSMLGEQLVLLAKRNVNESLLRKVLSNWPGVEHPKKIYSYENLQFTTSGKIDRKATLENEGTLLKDAE